MGEQLKNLKCIKNALSLFFSEQSILIVTDSGFRFQEYNILHYPHYAKTAAGAEYSDSSFHQPISAQTASPISVVDTFFVPSV